MAEKKKRNPKVASRCFPKFDYAEIFPAKNFTVRTSWLT